MGFLRTVPGGTPGAIPVTGYFGGQHVMQPPEPVRFNIRNYGITHRSSLHSGPLLNRAIRLLDCLAAGDADMQLPYDEAPLHWLLRKGHIRAREFRQNGYLDGHYLYEMTDSGKALHKRYAAPQGEW